MQSERQLLEVIAALRHAGGFARLLDGGQQQRNEKRDDCDDDEEFNQRKPCLAVSQPSRLSPTD
jgi:hypothetical protein